MKKVGKIAFETQRNSGKEGCKTLTPQSSKFDIKDTSWDRPSSPFQAQQ